MVYTLRWEVKKTAPTVTENTEMPCMTKYVIRDTNIASEELPIITLIKADSAIKAIIGKTAITYAAIVINISTESAITNLIAKTTKQIAMRCNRIYNAIAMILEAKIAKRLIGRNSTAFSIPVSISFVNKSAQSIKISKGSTKTMRAFRIIRGIIGKSKLKPSVSNPLALAKRIMIAATIISMKSRT